MSAWPNGRGFDGHIAPISKEIIEELSDSVVPEICKAVRYDHFLSERHQPSRSYRMANALGPKRSELILREIIDKHLDAEKIWFIVEAVAQNTEPDSDEELLRSSTARELVKFASAEFWRSFFDESEIPAWFEPKEFGFSSLEVSGN